MKQALWRLTSLLLRWGPPAVVCLSVSGCLATCTGLDGIASVGR